VTSLETMLSRTTSG